MKRAISRICAALTAAFVLTGCNSAASPSRETDGSSGAEQEIQVLASYYAAQSSPVFEYFQNASIQKFLAMWVKEETKEIESPVWNLDSFTQIQLFDHDLGEVRPDEQLYCCTFTDGADRCGYIIVQYEEQGPSLSNLGVTETTPYLYDLRANREAILASLEETDLDLETTAASRISLIDRDNKRGDQVIRFTDKIGNDYICYFGETTFEMEKWPDS